MPWVLMNFGWASHGKMYRLPFFGSGAPAAVDSVADLQGLPAGELVVVAQAGEAKTRAWLPAAAVATR